ncbi:MAG: RNA-binding cell elongation regulator Jag/EloR [Ilumatobacteraceae bacterium]
MEWVETTAGTIEEAKNKALDQLGVAEDDADFEILEEPKSGLFGRTRGEARVRARVKPRTPRGKTDRRRRDSRGEKRAEDRGAGSERDGQRTQGRNERGNRAPQYRNKRENQVSNDSEQGGRRERSSGPAPDPTQVAAEAEKFLAGLVDAFGLTATTGRNIEGVEIEVTVSGNDLGILVGPRGSTMQAVQDLTRVVSQRRLGDHETRLRIDIAQYRAKRKEALSRFVNQVADEVVASGTARALEPMPSADRKIIHDALTGRTDISTHSEGEDPDRRVVISPAS